MQDSLEQTILKLRDRVTFLERANQTLAADRQRVMNEFMKCEEILGGLGGLSLSGALAVRLQKIARQTSIPVAKTKRRDWRADSYVADTGIIGDELLAG